MSTERENVKRKFGFIERNWAICNYSQTSHMVEKVKVRK